MDQETRLREIALDQAVRLRDRVTEPDAMVIAAGKFYAFLKGEKPTNED